MFEPLSIILYSLAAIVFSLFFGLLFMGVDRKLYARMQSRIGPPILQPFYDVLKLLGKEIVRPRGASSLYSLAPIFHVATAAALAAYVPFGLKSPLSHYGDVIVIIYLIMLSAFAVVLGGAASGSPFSSVGSQRELVLMVSIDAPMLVSLLTLAWLSPGFSAFSLEAISKHPPLFSENQLVRVLGLLLLVGVVMWYIGDIKVGITEVEEAETEIAGGPLAEYSGPNLAMFEMGRAIRLFVGASLIVNLFFPQDLSTFLSLQGPLLEFGNVCFHLLKTFLVVFLAVTFHRTTFGRLKISSVASLYWKYIIPLTLVSSVAAIVLRGMGVI